jgi:hypothetical protein
VTLPQDIVRVLRRSLTSLTSDRDRVDQQIAAIQAALAAVNGRPLGGADRLGIRRGRRRMSAAARKAIGRRMKAYWAKRRAQAKAK